jgi:hypothetical protein
MSSFRIEGEAAELWAWSITELRDACALWDALRAGDEERLDQLVPIIESKYMPWGNAPQLNPDTLRQTTAVARTKLKLPEVARTALTSMVSSKLHRGISAQVEPPSGSRDRWRLAFEPESLLQTMWLQFAFALAGDIDYQQCVVCSKWFEVAEGLGRRDKQYCSDACRMRAYRKRKGSKS